MDAQIQSRNTALASSLRRSLVPSGGQVVVLVLFSTLILVLVNATALWASFTGSVGVSTDTADSVVIDKISSFSDFTGSLFSGRLAPMLFWAFLGIVTYTIIWFFQNTAANIRNDISARDFEHPDNLDNQTYWRTVAAHKVSLVCVALAMMIFTYMCFSYWLPLLGKIFFIGVTSWEGAMTLLKVSWSILITALLLYAFIIGVRIVHNTWRSINNNL